MYRRGRGGVGWGGGGVRALLWAGGRAVCGQTAGRRRADGGQTAGRRRADGGQTAGRRRADGGQAVERASCQTSYWLKNKAGRCRLLTAFASLLISCVIRCGCTPVVFVRWIKVDARRVKLAVVFKREDTGRAHPVHSTAIVRCHEPEFVDVVPYSVPPVTCVTMSLLLRNSIWAKLHTDGLPFVKLMDVNVILPFASMTIFRH